MPRKKGSKNKKVDETPKVASPESTKSVEKATDQEIKPEVKKATFVYSVPETKEDYLALIQCLKDTGSTDVSNLEVKASRL